MQKRGRGSTPAFKFFKHSDMLAVLCPLHCRGEVARRKNYRVL